MGSNGVDLLGWGAMGMDGSGVQDMGPAVVARTGNVSQGTARTEAAAPEGIGIAWYDWECWGLAAMATLGQAPTGREAIGTARTGSKGRERQHSARRGRDRTVSSGLDATGRAALEAQR